MRWRLDDKFYLRQGTSTDGAFSLVVTPEQAGWTYSGLKVLTLPPGGSHTWATGEDEAELEEIYYFETEGLAYQRVYGTPGRPIDVLAEVSTGDVILIPHGWHGPSIAAPGYALYYLNVMAGPEPVRSWRFCDDPAHAWIRGTWHDQAVDPRLPMTSARES